MSAIAERSLLSVDASDRLLDVLQRGITSLPPDEPLCLVHNDLGPRHIFVEPDTGRLTSIIDFDDAQVGRPEYEFFVMWERWWQRPDDVLMVLDGYDRIRNLGPEF